MPLRDAFQKKIAEKETLVHTGGRGVKKSPFFSSSKRGHILMGGGVNFFCPIFHVHFCVSVSTQFVAFLEALSFTLGSLQKIILKENWIHPKSLPDRISKGQRVFINSPLKKCILSLLLEGGRGSVNICLCHHSSCFI